MKSLFAYFLFHIQPSFKNDSSKIGTKLIASWVQKCPEMKFIKKLFMGDQIVI